MVDKQSKVSVERRLGRWTETDVAVAVWAAVGWDVPLNRKRWPVGFLSQLVQFEQSGALERCDTLADVSRAFLQHRMECMDRIEAEGRDR